MKIHIIRVTLFVTVIMILSASAWGQDETSQAGAVTIPTPVDKGPEDALGRGNPRGSISGYLDSASSFNWEKAAEYLDQRDLPPAIAEIDGAELARQFNQVLSRSVWLDDFSISDSAEGLQGDGLPPYRDELVQISTKSGPVVLWMQKIPRGDGVSIWKISNRSVALIPELYDEFSYPAPIEKIRSWFPGEASFLGIEAFKWFILLIVSMIAWPILWALGVLLSRLFSSPDREIYPLVRRVFTGPLVFIGILFTISFVITRLGAGAYAQKLMNSYTLATIALIWVSWSIISLIKSYQQEKLIRKDRPGAAKLLQPLSTLLKIVILIFGVLIWLSNIGVNITTVLAGLGVGGLAVALALQKPIEDMMGALTIFSQAPIRVGDFCRYGKEMGVVEDIGLRTTRLRTLSNTIVSIPNAQIASVEVENLSYRTKIRFCPTLRLRYDTTAPQIREITHNILEMLKASPRLYDEPLRVRFTDFAEDAILLKINAFVQTTDFSEFLEVAEELNISIMEIVQKAGAQFALPGRSLYTESRGSSVSQ